MPGTSRALLPQLRTYAVFTYPFACVPFLYFWFAAHGIGLADFGMLNAVYYGTMCAAEVPTGILADRVGRKIPMVLGPLFLSAAFVVMAAWPDLAGFSIGQILFGLGHSLLSGPPSALLYEHLHGSGRSTAFLAEEGLMHACRLHGTGGAFVLGGVVAWVWGFGATLWLTAVLCALAVPVALAVREPQRRTVGRTQVMAALWRDLRKPQVRWILCYFTLLFVLLRYGFHNYQPFLAALQGDLESLGSWWPVAVGTLYFALNLVAAECSRRTPRWVGTDPGPAWFLGLALLMCVGIAAMALPVGLAGGLFFFLQQVPFGMHWALVQDYANHRIDSRARTTVLSSMSLAGRLCFALVSWPLFALQESMGNPAAFLTVAVCGVAATALLGALVRRHPFRSGGSAA